MMFRRKDVASSFKLYKETSEIKYFALKSTPSGHIVVQLAGSNNLAIYDRKLRLIGEI